MSQDVGKLRVSDCSISSVYRFLCSLIVFVLTSSCSLGELVSYLRFLCSLVRSGVHHILCCLFLRLVYPMLPVSLDCPFFISLSVFANDYLLKYYTLMTQFHSKDND